MRSRQYIKNLATNIVGEKQLRHFQEMRKTKGISDEAVRSIFTVYVLEALIKMKLTPETLGFICTFGRDLGNDRYEKAFLVTYGTNAWSAVFISDRDSGKTLLEKIAVATILKEVYSMINVGMPDFENSWSLVLT